MPRIRTVKPDHWSDAELINISLGAHLLWIGSWNFSDDEGVFESDPLLIKSQVFPRRTDIRVEQVSQWLDQLVKARYIVPFEYEKKGYYITRTFKTHQKIDRPHPSKIPSKVLKTIVGYSTKVRRSLDASKGEYSKVKERKVFVPPGLDEVKEYFKKEGYREDIAEKAFKGYDVADWHDSQGTKIKNWKQKMINVWFRDEYKLKNNGVSLKDQVAALKNATPGS